MTRKDFRAPSWQTHETETGARFVPRPALRAQACAWCDATTTPLYTITMPPDPPLYGAFCSWDCAEAYTGRRLGEARPYVVVWRLPNQVISRHWTYRTKAEARRAAAAIRAGGAEAALRHEEGPCQRDE